MRLLASAIDRTTALAIAVGAADERLGDQTIAPIRTGRGGSDMIAFVRT